MKRVLAGFLVDAMIGRTSARHHKRVRGIDPKARARLAETASQGDVRALQEAIESLVGAAPDGVMITTSHVRAAARSNQHGACESPGSSRKRRSVSRK